MFVTQQRTSIVSKPFGNVYAFDDDIFVTQTWMMDM